MLESELAHYREAGDLAGVMAFDQPVVEWAKRTSCRRRLTRIP